MGLGQVLGKLGMQQPHGERHHGAWTEGRDRRGNQGKIKKRKTGWDEDRGDREEERETGREKDRESKLRI